jgi:hypothetical protein
MKWTAVTLIAFFMILRFVERIFEALLQSLQEPEILVVFLLICIAFTLAHIHDEKQKQEERKMKIRYKYGNREERRTQILIRGNVDVRDGGAGQNREELVVFDETRTKRYQDS